MQIARSSKRNQLTCEWKLYQFQGYTCHIHHPLMLINYANNLNSSFNHKFAQNVACEHFQLISFWHFSPQNTAKSTITNCCRKSIGTETRNYMSPQNGPITFRAIANDCTAPDSCLSIADYWWITHNSSGAIHECAKCCLFFPSRFVRLFVFIPSSMKIESEREMENISWQRWKQRLA